jgi:UDP-N-acetylmuramyl pentapeptide phosphotransferase/UDP-N-acetylglucosamine-1-phosphate transferase/glycosyltransferase involved in cell wall biosynthesis
MGWNAIWAGIAACLLSLILTKLSIKLAIRHRLFDKPEPRKVHQQPTPRFGGVAIILAALAVGVPAFCWLADFSTADGREEAWRYLALAVGALCVFTVGVLDDIWGVSSKLKLITLLAASGVLCASGAGLDSLVYDFEAYIRFPWLSWILTAIWITGMAVAFNFIDGLDGLAGGLALMAFAVLGFFQLDTGNFAAATPPLVVAGAIAGFLYFNRHPAKTFMGDGGSLTLGYLLGAMTITANADPKLGTMRAIILPSLAMSVPILDAALTMFRRRYEQRRSMFTAERGHIHHRLMDRGLSHRQTVQLIHAVSAACVLIGFCSLPIKGLATFGGLSLVVPVLWALFHAAGSVRTNEMVSAIRRKREIDRTSRRYRTSFEQLQLEFDGAHTFSHWWRTVCSAAEQLHFSQVELPIEAKAGEPRTFRWVNASDEFEEGCQRIDARIPIPLYGAVGETAAADIRVPIVASLESAGERLSLFSRLMAENGYQALRRINQLQVAAEQAEAPIATGEFGHLRVAIVHDFFYTYAGAERVVEQLINIFPHCDVFGLFDFLPEDQRHFLKGKKVHTTFLQKLPFARTKHRAYLPLMPLAIEQLDVSAYDLVVSSSYLAAKGVITGPDQLHICYCHSPARYAWDLQHQYLREAGLGYGPKGMLARVILHYLRNWDARSSLGVDHFIANSCFIAGRIKKTYRRDAEVIAPPVDTQAFSPIGEDEREDYYLAASRLVGYKRMELIVEAFNQMPDRRLVVIGDGPEWARIEAIAGANITLLGRQPREVLVEHMQRARALVFAAEEDFGIVPVESLACGTPVIAFAKGGVTESVREGRTGVFFQQQTVESLRDAVTRFEASGPLDEVDRKAARQRSERYSVEQFVERMTDSVRKALQSSERASGRAYRQTVFRTDIESIANSESKSLISPAAKEEHTN